MTATTKRRWKVERCSKERGEAWSQTWWTTNPIDSDGHSCGQWSDFPTWREALNHAMCDGAPPPSPERE